MTVEVRCDRQLQVETDNGWFTEGFGTLVLQEAKALLQELSADPSAGVGDGLAPVSASAGTA
jgi:hypothetical protein